MKLSEIKKELFLHRGSEYQIVSVDKKEKKLVVKHTPLIRICDSQFKISVYDLLKTSSQCPICSEWIYNRFEKKLIDILKDYDISLKRISKRIYKTSTNRYIYFVDDSYFSNLTLDKKKFQKLKLKYKNKKICFIFSTDNSELIREKLSKFILK